MGDVLYLQKPTPERRDDSRVARALGRLMREAAKQERQHGVRELRQTLRAGAARVVIRNAVAAEKAAIRQAEARAAVDAAAADARNRAALDLEADRLRDRIAAGDAAMRAVQW